MLGRRDVDPHETEGQGRLDSHSDVSAKAEEAAVAEQFAQELEKDETGSRALWLGLDLEESQTTKGEQGGAGCISQFEGRTCRRPGLHCILLAALGAASLRPFSHFTAYAYTGNQQDWCSFCHLLNTSWASLLETQISKNVMGLNTSAKVISNKCFSEVGLDYILKARSLVSKWNFVNKRHRDFLDGKEDDCHVIAVYFPQANRAAFFHSGQVALGMTTGFSADKKKTYLQPNVGQSRLGTRFPTTPSNNEVSCESFCQHFAPSPKSTPVSEPHWCNRLRSGGAVCVFQLTATFEWNSSVASNAGDGFALSCFGLPVSIPGNFVLANSMERDNASILESFMYAYLVPEGKCRSCLKQICRRFLELDFQACESRDSGLQPAVEKREENYLTSEPRRDLKSKSSTKQAEPPSYQTDRTSDLTFYILCGILAFTIVLGIFILVYTWLRKRKRRRENAVSFVNGDVQLTDFP